MYVPSTAQTQAAGIAVPPTSMGANLSDNSIAVPRRPLQGYDKSGAIDTLLLGSEPIGIQTGKCGPERQKFVCAKCRKKRWIMDSVAGCAAELTRFSVCSICDVKDLVSRESRERRKENSTIMAELSKLRGDVEVKLQGFNSRLSELESREPAGVVESSSVLRSDFDSLRQQLLGDMDSMRSMVQAKDPERQPATFAEAVQQRTAGEAEVVGQQLAGVAEAVNISLPMSCTEADERYIEEMYRSVVVMDEGDLRVSLRSGNPPTTKKSGAAKAKAPLEGGCKVNSKPKAKKKKRSRKHKRRKRGGQARQSGHPPDEKPVILLMGDSLVGKATAAQFTKLDPSHRCSAFPGAGIARVTAEVGKLKPASRNTLVLSVGGNDFFRRDKKPCNVEELMEAYGAMLKVARTKTDRCVLVGLIPRKSYSEGTYRAACVVNAKLDKMCRDRGIRFVKPWDHFYKVERFYRKDGVHLTDQGSRTLALILSKNLFGPARVRTKPQGKAPTSSRHAPRGSRKNGKVAAKGGVPRQPLEGSQEPVATVEETVEAEASLVSTAIEPPAASVQASTSNSDASKRLRSPVSEVDLTSPVNQSPRRKRKRSSEGASPTLRSSPRENSDSPAPAGN